MDLFFSRLNRNKFCKFPLTADSSEAIPENLWLAAVVELYLLHLGPLITRLDRYFRVDLTRCTEMGRTEIFPGKTLHHMRVIRVEQGIEYIDGLRHSTTPRRHVHRRTSSSLAGAGPSSSSDNLETRVSALKDKFVRVSRFST
ncbi:unnamed protein product [Linum trigynum]|uniref:Uncharacterized protein n=1 Tax=Linum trigynum TaxID=586398 RepID=A0AAV2DZU4_9ROSI